MVAPTAPATATVIIKYSTEYYQKPKAKRGAKAAPPEEPPPAKTTMLQLSRSKDSSVLVTTEDSRAFRVDLGWVGTEYTDDLKLTRVLLDDSYDVHYDAFELVIADKVWYKWSLPPSLQEIARVWNACQ